MSQITSNTQATSPSTDTRRRDLMQIAVNSWGTASVLGKRISLYSLLINVVSYIGFILPLLVGVYAIAFGVNANNLSLTIVIVSGVLAVQALASATLIFYGAEAKLKEALNSSTANKIFAVEAEELAKNVSLPENIFGTSSSLLIGKTRVQESIDERLGFTAKDRRIAARAGMKRFNLSCNGCGQIPKSADAKADKSICNDCGDF